MQRCSHSFSTATALRSIFFPTNSQTCVSTFLAPSYATDFVQPYPIYRTQTRSQSSYSRSSYTPNIPLSTRAPSTSYGSPHPRGRGAMPDLRKFGAQEQRRPKDEEIKSQEILLVDKNSAEPRHVWLRDVLRTIDREKEFVVQVGLEGEDETAQPFDETDSDAESDEGEEPQLPPEIQRTPVCKIMARKEYFLGEQSKGKKTTGAKKSKEIELSWSVDKNDLNHRLSKVEGFLAEGRKVEIFLAPKKRGKQISAAEAEAVVGGIKERLLQGTSFKESKAMEGVVGETLTLFFEKKA